MGDGASAVLNYSFSMAKCLTGSFSICDQLKRTNPDTFLIARTLQTNYGMIDCPQEWNYESPETWWSAIKSHLPLSGYNAYEIQNECGPPPKGYPYWAEWSIKMAQLVERDTDGVLLAFGFAAGNPDLPYWNALQPYIDWVTQHGKATGIWHGIALHQSVYAPWNRTDMPWVNNLYLAGRHTLIPQLKNWQGLVILTEAGLSDGYSGNWTAAYSCEEVRSALTYSLKQYQTQGIIDGLIWWNFGKVSRWTSDHACLPIG